MEEYYQSDLKISNLPLETFVNNVVLFVMSYGKQLLHPNSHVIVGLEQYHKQRNAIYTAKLIEKQNLEAANTAWKNKDYFDVVKFLDKVDETKMPESYKTKYKIAKDRISRDF